MSLDFPGLVSELACTAYALDTMRSIPARPKINAEELCEISVLQQSMPSSLQSLFLGEGVCESSALGKSGYFWGSLANFWGSLANFSSSSTASLCCFETFAAHYRGNRKEPAVTICLATPPLFRWTASHPLSQSPETLAVGKGVFWKGVSSNVHRLESFRDFLSSKESPEHVESPTCV